MRRAGEDETLADRAMADWRGAGLSERHAAIAAWAGKSTRDPDGMEEADLAPLRAQGLSDEDILTLAHVVSFFNGVNRVADGLRVDPEPRGV